MTTPFDVEEPPYPPPPRGTRAFHGFPRLPRRRGRVGAGAPTPFDEVQFPPSLALGAAGGPQFSTTVVVLGSGYENRNQNWEASRGSWDAGIATRTPAQMAFIITFFRARWGRARGFRFRDWSDYQLGSYLPGGSPQQIATGDGETTVFQLVKTYSDGVQTYNRTIAKPVAPPALSYVGGSAGWATASNTVAIYLNGAKQSSGWSVDATTGLVTFGSAPGGGVIVAADALFDTPARFDVDQLDVSVLDALGNAKIARLPILEIRV